MTAASREQFDALITVIKLEDQLKATVRRLIPIGLVGILLIAYSVYVFLNSDYQPHYPPVQPSDALLYVGCAIVGLAFFIGFVRSITAREKRPKAAMEYIAMLWSYHANTHDAQPNNDFGFGGTYSFFGYEYSADPSVPSTISMDGGGWGTIALKLDGATSTVAVTYTPPRQNDWESFSPHRHNDIFRL